MIFFVPKIDDIMQNCCIFYSLENAHIFAVLSSTLISSNYLHFTNKNQAKKDELDQS